MKYRLFQYTLPAEPELTDLNAFLANHRIATVHQHLVTTSGGAMLVFVVEVASSPAGGHASQGGSKPRIDYREVLSEQEFEVFSKLRTARKEMAAAEGVPIYAVFSNAQLAEMVQNKLTTKRQLAAIAGIGNARADKYAEQVLPILSAAYQTDETSSLEAES